MFDIFLSNFNFQHLFIRARVNETHCTSLQYKQVDDLGNFPNGLAILCLLVFTAYIQRQYNNNYVKLRSKTEISCKTFGNRKTDREPKHH